MVYADHGELIIRDFTHEDAEAITRGECAQGWHASIQKYEDRLADVAAGKCVALAAVLRGEAVGYINVYLPGEPVPETMRGLPQIVDFGVLEKARRQGIGSKLMDAAEALAARYSDRVCLGVGLHSGYGSAQRMYIKRGYIPDGVGAYHGHEPCRDYATYCLDDELCLYLSKKL